MRWRDGLLRAWTGWLLLLPLCWLLFFHHLDRRDLWNSHEARAAMDAQTILDDGDWGLPHLYDGRPELQKPPLYYWLVALIGRSRDSAVDEWTVRLPAALSACACVLLLYAAGIRRGRPSAGLAAAAVLATAMHFTWLARVARIDMPLTLAVSVVLFALPLDRERLAGSQGLRDHFCLAAAYVALAAAVLLKGPIGLVLPTAVAGPWLLVSGQLPSLREGQQWVALARRFGLWWGIPLVLGLTLPWFFWANNATEGELFRVFFWHHNFERGFGGSEDLRAHPWWFYGPEFLWDFLPWSPLLLAAGWWLWRRGGWRDDAEARFGLVWLVAVMAVLSCVRFKRADYLLPAYPGAALVIGCAIERWYRLSRHPQRIACGFALAVAACAAGWLIHVDYQLPAQEATREYREFASAVRQLAPAPQTVSFFRTEAHALAFHVGRPLRVFVEWEELDALAARPETSYVVMPVAVAAELPQFLRSGRWEEVLRNTGTAPGHEKPFVLLRVRPP